MCCVRNVSKTASQTELLQPEALESTRAYKKLVNKRAVDKDTALLESMARYIGEPDSKRTAIALLAGADAKEVFSSGDYFMNQVVAHNDAALLTLIFDRLPKVCEQRDVYFKRNATRIAQFRPAPTAALTVLAKHGYQASAMSAS